MNPFAIYFPQFYPIPTNDRAWGKGFTDWSLIARANMLDEWERRAPAMGFYDGSDPEVHFSHMRQALAAGIGGFAVYHYWFYTHQELDAFERTALSGVDPEHSIPWFLIWACEGWSRRWLGDPRTLVELTARPTSAEIQAHCDHLARCFSHPFYYQHEGRPLFAWYHLAQFEEPGAVIEKYREALRRRGFDVLFAQFLKNPYEAMYCSLVDITYLFEPRLFFAMQGFGHGARGKAVLDAVTRRLGQVAARRLLLLHDRLRGRGAVYDAAGFEAYLGSPRRETLRAGLAGSVQEVVTPGWNNAPRYGARSTCLQNLPAVRFGENVREASARSPLPPLINAWNEWSEGAAIEPCAYLGTAYLDALRRTAR
jgi:hypothetical protein